MPSLKKHDAEQTLRSRLELLGAEASTLSLEMDRGKLTARQMDAITDAIDMIYTKIVTRRTEGA